MKPRFQADADFNQKDRSWPAPPCAGRRFRGCPRGRGYRSTRSRCPPQSGRSRADFDFSRPQNHAAHVARFLDSRSSPGLIIAPQDLDIGLAIEDLLIIWAASDAEEWTDKVGFLPW